MAAKRSSASSVAVPSRPRAAQTIWASGQGELSSAWPATAAQAGCVAPDASCAATRNDARSADSGSGAPARSSAAVAASPIASSRSTRAANSRLPGSSTGPGAVRSAFCRAASVGSPIDAGSREKSAARLGGAPLSQSGPPRSASAPGSPARQAPGAGRSWTSIVGPDGARGGSDGTASGAAGNSARGVSCPATGQDSRAVTNRRPPVGPMRASVVVARRERRSRPGAWAPGCPRWRGTGRHR